MIAQRLAVGSLTNALAQVSSFAAWLVLTPVILGHVGPNDYGLWVLARSVIGCLALLDLGIMGAMVKRVAEHRARGDAESLRILVTTTAALASLVSVTVVTASVAMAAAFPWLFHVPAEPRTFWLVIVVGIEIGLAVPCGVPMSVLRGLQRFDLDNAASIGTTLLVAAGITIALFLGAGVLGVAAVVALMPVAMLLLRVLMIRRVAPEVTLGRAEVHRDVVRSVLAFGSPLAAQNAAGMIQARTGDMVIGAFLPVGAVTPFAIARSLAEIGQKLSYQFVKVLLPLASELDASGAKERLRALYLDGSRVCLAIMVPVATLLVLLAGPILTLWLGPAYARHAPLVVILTLAIGLDTSQWTASAILQGIGRHRPLAAMSVVAALVNALVAILLARPLGVTGVALGALVSAVVTALALTLPYAGRVLGVGPYEAFRRVAPPALLPAVPMALTVHVATGFVEPSSWPGLAAVAFAGAAVYAATYVSLGADAAERRTYAILASGLVRAAVGAIRRSGSPPAGPA